MTISGFNIVGMANNGEEAIGLFKKLLSTNEIPDVIIMDHRMPIKNGLEATKEILQINKSVKIIFASADESIKEFAFSAGAYSFIEKPFRFSFMVEEINKIKANNQSLLI